MMKEDRREQSEQSPDQAKFCKHKQEGFNSDNCSFFLENKSYGVKKQFALILCLPLLNISLRTGTLYNETSKKTAYSRFSHI